jgi:hypothetical protein
MSSEVVCNLDTYRCEHRGTLGAEAGTPCTLDDDCEPNGVCLAGPGGYCSKLGCSIAGNECEGDGVCAFGAACLAPCNVGSSDATTEYVDDTQGCRKDYTCIWGRGQDDPSGFCFDEGLFNDFTVNFNDFTVNNIGDACTSSDECYSPFGYGGCNPDFHCTVVECGAPGVPSDICGNNATCIDFLPLFGPDFDLFACLKTCESAVDCLVGDACADLFGDGSTQVCWPTCLNSDECREDEDCVLNNQVATCTVKS